MTGVLDANVIVALLLNEPRSAAVAGLVAQWPDQRESLATPTLALYEVANGLTEAMGRGAYTVDLLPRTVETISLLSLATHDVTRDLPRIVAVACELERSSAYDAAYLVLAEELGVTLWTLDGPLCRNAMSIGAPVRLVE